MIDSCSAWTCVWLWVAIALQIQWWQMRGRVMKYVHVCVCCVGETWCAADIEQWWGAPAPANNCTRTGEDHETSAAAGSNEWMPAGESNWHSTQPHWPGSDWCTVSTVETDERRRHRTQRLCRCMSLCLSACCSQFSYNGLFNFFFVIVGVSVLNIAVLRSHIELSGFSD